MPGHPPHEEARFPNDPPARSLLWQLTLDGSDIQRKLEVLRTLGHPYSDDQIAAAPGELAGKSEMDAMVAYLQSLGTAVRTRR